MSSRWVLLLQGGQFGLASPYPAEPRQRQSTNGAHVAGARMAGLHIFRLLSVPAGQLHGSLQFAPSLCGARTSADNVPGAQARGHFGSDLNSSCSSVLQQFGEMAVHWSAWKPRRSFNE